MDGTLENAEPGSSKFASQNTTAEDMLKSQTIGLVPLSDFRKRRADAIEARDRDSPIAPNVNLTSDVAASSPGCSAPAQVKKRKNPTSKGKLSFAVDEEDGACLGAPSEVIQHGQGSLDASSSNTATAESVQNRHQKVRIGPNTTVSKVPKVMTKSALSKAAQTKEELRKEFLIMQESIRASEIVIPFVFYDGTNIPGGTCRMKKGDAVWLFLDRARKVGAELGVRGADTARREWARVSVDDLMLVKHEIIIPHHYDFYYFIMNSIKGFHGLLFDYSQRPTQWETCVANTKSDQTMSDKPIIDRERALSIDDNANNTVTEGTNHDPTFTKVVDRRWYERNKHIYPASVWEEFDPTKEYEHGLRKDTQGNSFFLG